MQIRRHAACLPLLLLCMSSTSMAQNWSWVRDDLVLNPSGLDLSHAASWAWGDLDGDGRDDVIVRERDGYNVTKLVAYRGRAPVSPPYWTAAPELLEGLNAEPYSLGISLADLYGDGSLNAITRAEKYP